VDDVTEPFRLALCFHCEEIRAHHMDDGQCLFAPTKYQDMTWDQIVAYAERKLDDSRLPSLQGNEGEARRTRIVSISSNDIRGDDDR